MLRKHRNFYNQNSLFLKVGLKSVSALMAHAAVPWRSVNRISRVMSNVLLIVSDRLKGYISKQAELLLNNGRNKEAGPLTYV